MLPRSTHTARLSRRHVTDTRSVVGGSGKHTAVEGTCWGHASCFVKRLGLHIRRKVATEGIRGASFPVKSRPENLRQCCARLRSLWGGLGDLWLVWGLENRAQAFCELEARFFKR